MKNRLMALMATAVLGLLPLVGLAQQEPVQMNNLAVTDLSVSTAFISWATDQLTTGNKIEVSSADSTWRVADAYVEPAYVHLVQITGLQSSTAYNYKIISGEASWDSNGVNYRFSTMDSSRAQAPRTVWGKLQNSYGSPVERCLVRFRARTWDGTVSLPRVVISDDEGTWIGNAGIMYKQNGGPFDYSGDDKLITEYIPNYWSSHVDSTKEIGSGSNNYYGVESIQVTDPNASDPGDVDGNGAINIFDLLDLLKVMGKKITPDPRMQAASDLDANGRVDVFDLLELLKKMKAAKAVNS